MGTLIDGRAIAHKIQTQTAQKVQDLKAKGIVPKLGIVLVGNDPASAMYDRMKGEVAKKVGIDFVLEQTSEDITEAELINKINNLQQQNVSGLMIQLPLPERLYNRNVLNTINPKIDVDFLTDKNLGHLMTNSHYLMPPTAGAIMTILSELHTDLAGKNVTIIGMGILVGKPLSMLLINAGASITTCNSRTKDMKNKCLQADIIISGVGKKNLIRGDMVKEGTIVIDAGVSFEDGQMSGDVNMEEVTPKTSFITPTPGGVGPITVARLMLNTALSAQQNNI